jgi:hypothetical protein
MTWIKNNWLRILAAIMLACSILPIPYFAYYQLMNWVVVAAAIVVAWTAYQTKKEWAMWLFILIAIIFNPIAPLHLRTDIWQILDLVAALLFILSVPLVRK